MAFLSPPLWRSRLTSEKGDLTMQSRTQRLARVYCKFKTCYGQSGELMSLEFWLSQVDQMQMALFGGLVYQLWGHSRRAGLEEKRGEAAWQRNGHKPEQFWKYSQCFCKYESKSTYRKFVLHLVFRMSFVMGEFSIEDCSKDAWKGLFT